MFAPRRKRLDNKIKALGKRSSYQYLKLFDILKLKLRRSTRYQWVLVIGTSGNDLNIAYITHDEDDVLSTGLLRQLIGKHPIRITDDDEVLSSDLALSRATIGGHLAIRIDEFIVKNIVEGEDNADEAIRNIRLHIVAHFLDSKPLPALANKIMVESLAMSSTLSKELMERTTRVASELDILVKGALKLLIGLLAKRHLEVEAERNKSKVSKPFDKGGITQFVSELSVGDKLEFMRRGIYSHWGFFLGHLGDKTMFIHFCPEGNGKPFSFKKAFGLGSSARDKPAIRVDWIEKYLGNQKVRINNSLDRKWPPEPAHIVDNLLDRLISLYYHQPPKYNLLGKNCEHFVNELRYNVSYSKQIPLIMVPLAKRIQRCKKKRPKHFELYCEYLVRRMSLKYRFRRPKAVEKLALIYCDSHTEAQVST